MSNRVEGKVAIVTGAASGIGRGSALALAREGARVFATDRDGDGVAKVGAELGAPHEARVLDVTDEDGWAALVDHVVATAGRLDVLVNSAGIGVVGDIE